MQRMANYAVGLRRRRRGSLVCLKDLLYMVGVSMWAHVGFAIWASRMPIARAAKGAVEIPLKIALKVALLGVALVAARLPRARLSRRERRLRLEGGLVMKLLRLTFRDEFANSEAFLHRVIAVAQETFNNVRFGREGD